MFQKAKDIYKLQKQAKQIKKELQKIHIEAEVNGVIVIMNGEMDIIDIKIPEESLTNGGVRLAKDVMEAIKKAKKKAEQISAERMKDLMGGMGGFPGMG